MVLARDLLQHFGSVRRIANATEDELRGVRGIGAKKARQMLKVLGADYESVDAERNLEDAIETDPSLLFKRPVVLLARQHYIFADEQGRQFIDMVFLAPEDDEIILVELKRGKLARAHYEQLRRYLDHAHDSKLLRSFLDKGTGLQGVLATVEDYRLKLKDPQVSVRIVDRRRTIDVLKELRQQRLALL